MLKIYYIIVQLCFALNVSGADNFLLKQGSQVVDFAALDGFAYTIPAKDRFNYFQSSKRVEEIIKHMINQEHLAAYARKHLSQEVLSQVEQDAKSLADKSFRDNFGATFSLLNEAKLSLIEKYYQNKLLVIALRKNMLKNISNDDLLDISQEDYHRNKNKYYRPKSYNILYLSMNCEQDCTNERPIAQDLLKDLITGKLTFTDIIKEGDFAKYKLTWGKSLNNYKYDKAHLQLAEVLFAQEKSGIIDKVIEVNTEQGNKLLLVQILKINPEYQKLFSEVKDEILAKYRKVKLEKDMNALVLSLTQDPFETNDEAFLSIKTRYKPYKVNKK